MITDEHKAIILGNWKLVVPIADTAADLFYKRLFELRPQYRSFFKDDMRDQKAKLLKMLTFITSSLKWADSDWQASIPVEDDLFLVVLAMGRRHSELYKIPDEAYEPVLESLIWTLDYGLGKAFDERSRNAWALLFGIIANTMKLGRLMVEPKVKQ